MRGSGRGYLLAWLIATLILLGHPAAPAFAYDAALVGQAERAAAGFSNDLTRIEGELQLPSVTDALLTQERSVLDDIRTNALSMSVAMGGPITEVSQQITLLGPAPTGAKVDTPAVASQRASLTADLNRLQGVKSQLQLVSVTAEQLAARASALQRNLFLTRIFEGGLSILNPKLWLDMGLGAGLFTTRLTGLFSAWWSEVSPTANFPALAFVPIFLAICFSAFLLVRGKIRRLSTAYLIANRSPDDLDRLWRIVRAVLATVAILVFIFVPLYFVLYLGGFLTQRFELIFTSLADVTFSTATYWVLARRLAAPGLPIWRVINLDDAAAAKLPILVALTTLVSSLTRSIGSISDSLYLPVSYTIGQSALTALITLALVALIMLTLRNQAGLPVPAAGRRIYFTWAPLLAPVVWLLILAGAVALLAGYVALASFLAQQIFETAVLIAVLFLLHHLSDAAVAASLDPHSGYGKALRAMTGLGERGVERFGLIFRTIVDLLLIVAGLPLLFVLWTVTWIDVRGAVNTALFGFHIGNFTLSLWSVMMVLVTLVTGVVLTNLLVRWLDRRILSQTRVDKGVQDSLKKGASYAGYILAVGIAATSAGLDFSTLAIIAGALGVGIGFGLQSIVNNFVSGLILLVERPVRVGDWVALDAGEGLVKRINVRSTEIETFDNCSIIIPNSSLITGAVRNWTHGDNMGRLGVNLTVEYGSDANAVSDILLEAARAHPKVLTYPEPQVTLSRFSMYGLEFDLKAHVADIFDGAIVASELRFTILKALAEKAITIAQPVGLIQPPKP